MARDLVAKRIVEQYLRKKSLPKSKPQADPKDFLELPCCIEAAELQDCLERTERQLNQQAREFKVVSHARIQEVDQLAAEVSFLQKYFGQSSPQANGIEKSRMDLEVSSMQHQMELENLEQQLATLESEIESAEQQILQIKWAASSDIGQLTVLKALHEQEVAALQRRLLNARRASTGGSMDAEARGVNGGLAPFGSSSAEELGRSLQAAVTERESMETLLQTERAYRLEEICLLQKELRQVKSSTWFSSSNTRSTEVLDLHQSLSRVHNSLADPKALGRSSRAEDMRNLTQQMLQQVETVMES
eukprot:CAMPEP_0178441994 /NCGR_PEP_ID=MMETSP0689_2-20121128/37877_1 /TAXON_ID=160604 /ORGANISM="Amphidinium massartii, Strain CS-259" /LENGTH=303 /DNA_ID=CAMNT_0020065409 /DNA_START=1 /DNA_END=912 /DNA_ORIENTATION=+